MHNNVPARYEIYRAYRVLLGIILGFVGTGRWANPAKKFYFSVLFLAHFLLQNPFFMDLGTDFLKTSYTIC